jgi:sensor domain CHASE-containing protein
MSDNSVVSKIKELRKDLDKETNFLQQQMELPLNGNIQKNVQSENNSIQLSKGIAISKWVRKITSQFESVDPFYK